MAKLSGTIVTPDRPLLTDAMRPVLDLLTGAGIRVAVDVKSISPPGTFLHPPELVFRYRAGDFTATYRLLLVTSSKHREQSYDDMSQLMESVLVALGDAAVTARPADVETADQSTYLTAYEFIWTERVRQSKG